MNVRTLKDHFALIGARLMIEPARELWRAPKAARFEVRHDLRGAYFHLMVDPLRVISMDALKVDARDGMLVLAIRQRAFGRMHEAPRQVFLAENLNGLAHAHELAEAHLQPQTFGAPSRN